MLLANVLVGRFIKGQKEYRRPPLRNDPHDPQASYDSCVDVEHNPRAYCVFSSRQIYPAYVIQYLSYVVIKSQRPWCFTSSLDNISDLLLPSVVGNPIDSLQCKKRKKKIIKQKNKKIKKNNPHLKLCIIIINIIIVSAVWFFTVDLILFSIRTTFLLTKKFVHIFMITFILETHVLHFFKVKGCNSRFNFNVLIIAINCACGMIYLS